MRNKWVVGIAILAVVVAVAGIGYAKTNSDDKSSKNKDLIVLADAQRRTLQDTVTLNGTLARQELRKVTSIAQGRVSAVYAKDGSDAKVGARLFALDGRDAIAEPGNVRFFRPLGVGDRGDDVLQLKHILSASGYSPGPMNTVFTEQTRFALAQWQAQHHYPGAVPTTPQTVTVSLGAGLRLRARSPDLGRPDHRARGRRPHDCRLEWVRAPGRADGVPRRRGAARDPCPEDPVDQFGRFPGHARHVRDHSVGGERERHHGEPGLERQRDEQRCRHAAVDGDARRPTPPRCRSACPPASTMW